ncbi:MAG: hypothetical protein M3405_13055 [Acidobacteriota bacterium]|jgi:hypothetical protein|nr:hypothetical protein [Acidobacteriota bacterium]
MNINNRLNKLETELKINDSEFCECEKGFHICLPGDPPRPETCKKCGKKVSTLNFTFELNSNAKL